MGRRSNCSRIIAKGFCAVFVWFSQGVFSTIVKVRNVFKTSEIGQPGNSNRYS